MRNQGQLIIGALLLFLGLMLLFGNFLNIDVWALFWPLALIFLGVYLLLRPRFSFQGVAPDLQVFGGIRRSGMWRVENDEIWMFVGDVRLDMTQAEIPTGETHIRVLGFIGDVDLTLPKEIGLSFSSAAFVTDAKVNGQKHESFLAPYRYDSPNYAALERKVRLETIFFIGDIDVNQT